MLRINNGLKYDYLNNNAVLIIIKLTIIYLYNLYYSNFKEKFDKKKCLNKNVNNNNPINSYLKVNNLPTLQNPTLAEVLLPIQMEKSIKVDMSKDKDMAKENIPLQMVMSTLVSLLTIKSMV